MENHAITDVDADMRAIGIKRGAKEEEIERFKFADLAGVGRVFPEVAGTERGKRNTVMSEEGVSKHLTVGPLFKAAEAGCAGEMRGVVVDGHEVGRD